MPRCRRKPRDTLSPRRVDLSGRLRAASWWPSFTSQSDEEKFMRNRMKSAPATGRMLIGGQLVESSGGNWIESINPANEECIGKVPRGTAADVEQAVGAAETAQLAWAQLSVAQRVAPRLMAGKSVVLKPSEQTPVSATLLGEIATEVLPPGVLNIVTGDGEVGSALVRHPRVKRLSFVGSVRTGMAIQRSAAEVAVKSISLELGGKNPFIVFPDAPVEKVAEAAVLGMNFIWQGQSCSSTSRLFVHDSIYDEVVQRVVAKAEAIRIGDPFEWTTQMGAINSQAHLSKIESYVEIGNGEGARLVAGGSRPAGVGFQKGFWFQPTVFADVRQDMRIAREEIFGPVLSILRWSDVDDAIEMANSVEYGLTGAVWTRDIANALRTARRLQSGYIWINGVNSYARGKVRHPAVRRRGNGRT